MLVGSDETAKIVILKLFGFTFEGTLRFSEPISDAINFSLRLGVAEPNFAQTG